MLIHLAPQFLTDENSGPNVEVQTVRIPELDLTLQGGVDLVTRRPYPNKRYQVACRRKGQKAIDGFFIATDARIDRLTVLSNWLINNTEVVTHELHLTVMDEDFQGVTTALKLFHATSHTLGGWSSRWPDHLDEITPASGTPRMETNSRTKKGNIQDRYANGRISHRKEVLVVPTVEEERLMVDASWVDRMPSVEDAFHAKVVPGIL